MNYINFNYYYFKYYNIIINNFIKKIIYSPSKMLPIRMWVWSKCSARIPFSLHFFLITVIFLIFDIEIALLFPIIMSFNLVNFIMLMKISFFFLIILMMGLYQEWNQNMLNWTN
uniref:NADH-ubiquinone oxidoreductase chain 3 n=1 Tax=Parnassius nomion TaxID=213955 RepID=A0A0U1XG34_9NEOP|nr:NADH dehydrogenase subunit 3 [Parnassius nomion]AJR33134.1 NADH dehydrogenase subunit 3 [Parnassius nomion]